MKLYYHPFSFPALTTLFAAEAMDLEYENQVVDLQSGEQRSPEYLEINPYGRVPAMKDGEFCLSESEAILRYLARKSGKLYSDDIQKSAKIDQWMDFVVQHIRSPMARVQFNTFLAPMIGQDVDESSLATGRKFLANNLPIIEQQLSENPYLYGDDMTIADIALIGSLEPTNTAAIDLTPYPAIHAWLNKQRSESFYTNVHSHFGAELGLPA